jgi:hypothetical protein
VLATAIRIMAVQSAWAGLVLQYVVVAQTHPGPALLGATIRYLSYFTILSNILVGICLGCLWLAPRSALARFCAAGGPRTGLAVYISVTGLIYWLVLSRAWFPQGLEWVANVLMHYATPPLFLADWLVRTPRGMLAWRQAVLWLWLPLAFAVYSVVDGKLTGFYPYPFLNVTQLGLDAALRNMAILGAIFLVLGLLFIAVQRWRNRTMGASAAAPAGR